MSAEVRRPVPLFQTTVDSTNPNETWQYDVSRDGRFLLFDTVADQPARGDVLAFPVDRMGKLGGEPITVAGSQQFVEGQAQFSPDGRWIAFPVPLDAHRSRMAVARLSGNVIEDERDWSYLTPENFSASQPEWSPNGRWLYFLSDQSGKLAVWALNLSSEMRPRGMPRVILDPATERLSINSMRPRDIGLSIARDKLALAVTESSANNGQ